MLFLVYAGNQTMSLTSMVRLEVRVMAIRRTLAEERQLEDKFLDSLWQREFKVGVSCCPTLSRHYVTWYSRNKCELTGILCDVRVGLIVARDRATRVVRPLWSTSSSCFVHAPTDAATAATPTNGMTSSATTPEMTSLPGRIDVCITFSCLISTG